ncbi:MAG: M28 family peptidase [Planctomycetes bacterium]|nr:M28 family peptidase [Planctomycetota bacterium]
MIRSSISLFLLLALIFACGCTPSAQKQALDSITIGELATHMNFIAADETLGRDTPSQELKITCRYLATYAETYGLKPILPDGSYLQKIPVDLTKISETKSQLTLTENANQQTFHFPQAFGTSGRSATEGSVSGSVVFVGYGLNAPDQGWDDYANLDLTGKVVIMLNGSLTNDQQTQFRQLIRNRATAARRLGAAAVLTVISPEQEHNFIQNDTFFPNNESMPRYRPSYYPPSSTSNSRRQNTTAQTFLQVQIRQQLACTLLGISPSELNDMFTQLSIGQQVPPKEFPEKNIDLNIKINRRTTYTQNVVAYLEGSDPVLKNEYVVIGSHPDHLGVRNGQVMNGADDNVSGCIAMLEIAQALVIDRPKRSVIFGWFTGEERGLMGSHVLASQSPVPIEKISAMINLDMICRNNTDHLYLVAANLLSTELDGSINQMNDQHTQFTLDYEYEDPTHPQRFYSRSDHYPYNLFGVPAVWFFSGTTPDYHTPNDTIEKVDYQKMLNVTKLTYLVCCDIANQPEMLKLDVNPKITTRGPHNLATQLNR